MPLAAACSLSVTDLLNDSRVDAPHKPIERTVSRKLWSNPMGRCARLQASTSGRTMFELRSWTIMPGEVFQADGHSPDTRELVSVIQGSLRITVGADSIVLKAGESARLLTEQAHS